MNLNDQEHTLLVYFRYLFLITKVCFCIVRDVWWVSFALHSFNS